MVAITTVGLKGGGLWVQYCVAESLGWEESVDSFLVPVGCLEVFGKSEGKGKEGKL